MQNEFFFSKIKHATGNYARTKCFPFCISTIQYKSLRYEATEGVNKGLRCRSTPHEYAENLCHHSGLSA